MAGVTLELDPTSEDSANVPLVLVDNTTYFLLGEDWPSPEVDQSTVSSVGTEGEVPVTARHHNTTGTVQLRVIGSTAATLQTALNYIDKKLAKIMREGGTLKRTTPSGSTYVTDLVAGSAAFQFTRRYTASNRCEVTITFPRRPYWRGAAVTLALQSETTLPALIFTTMGSLYSSTVLADTPALYWRLGESVGTTAADASGNARTGTYTSIILAQTGAIAGDGDTAIAIDADNDAITSTYAGWASGRTWECWINKDATGLGFNRNIMVGDGANDPRLYLDGADATSPLTVIWDPNNSVGGGTGSWANVLTTGAWHHLVLTQSGTTAELFIDGSSQGTRTVEAFGATPGNFRLGSDKTGGFALIGGKLDEVAVYTSVLSAARITAHYSAGTTITPVPIQGDVGAA